MSLVQQFTLEADTFEQLRSGCEIVLGWHRRVTHYIEGKTLDGTPFLSLLWAEKGDGCQKLLAPLTGAADIATQVAVWLKEADYGRAPDHDGDNKKGYKLSIRSPRLYQDEWRSADWDFYVVLTVLPRWIEYHK